MAGKPILKQPKSRSVGALYFNILKDIMENSTSKPFSQAYVLRTTLKHMRKSVDISISKTFERVDEFKDNQAKSSEVFQTLATLHSLRKSVDSFQTENQEAFSGAQ